MLSSKSVITLLLLGAIGLSGCKKDNPPVSETLNIPFKLKSSWPHGVESFTQGFVIHEGQLYESAGQEKSWIGIIDIKTGKPDKKVVLDDKYFGEGITILNNKIYQLTWTSDVIFVYDLRTFKKLAEFDCPTKEGWGITHDTKNLIISDGTSTITFLDTLTLKPVRKIEVKNNDEPVADLNELEFVDGAILANKWKTNYVFRIDPTDGKVTGVIDLTVLMQNARMLNPQADVLNGIAYHSATGLVLVTGKYWPKIYALQLLK